LGSADIKLARKTLVKLTPGLNFINVLRTAFTRAEEEVTDDLTVFFTLLGSTSIKASRKTLVKLTPGDTLDVDEELRTLRCINDRNPDDAHSDQAQNKTPT